MNLIVSKKTRIYLASFGHGEAASEQEDDVPGNSFLSFLP